MKDKEHAVDAIATERIGQYAWDEFLEAGRIFHGYPAPGLLIGAFMVEYAKTFIPENTLFDAICETSSCLPDAVQMLTPCTVGNGWLKVMNLGLYALSLYDKHTGEGVRVYLDSEKLEPWPHIACWLYKSKPKREQDSDALRESIRQAGISVCSAEPVAIKDNLLEGKSKGPVGRCEICGQAYPLAHGSVCRGCQGDLPYKNIFTVTAKPSAAASAAPVLHSVPVEEARGKRLLHDMTRIVPGVSKGAVFRKGQVVEVGDVCRLQQMGRFSVYLDDQRPDGDWVHEDEAAKAFGEAMAGEGVRVDGPPREGKVNLSAVHQGLLLVDVPRLERFNMVEGVMAACRKGNTVVKENGRVAGTRAIPLFLPRKSFLQAMAVLWEKPLFEIKPLKKSRVGILITGNEVFHGLIEDKFEGVLSNKLAEYGCTVTRTIIVPDDETAIAKALGDLLQAGSEIVLTTAGLSVDPEDVTRKGLILAGAHDMLYGMPVLPGAMTLLARLGEVRILGIPACALFFKTTSLDVLLPRLLAGQDPDRADLARLAHGGLCLECRRCSFPKCSFGR